MKLVKLSSKKLLEASENKNTKTLEDRSGNRVEKVADEIQVVADPVYADAMKNFKKTRELVSERTESLYDAFKNGAEPFTGRMQKDDELPKSKALEAMKLVESFKNFISTLDKNVINESVDSNSKTTLTVTDNDTLRTILREARIAGVKLSVKKLNEKHSVSYTLPTEESLLETFKLEERIPKDLAKAYRTADFNYISSPNRFNIKHLTNPADIEDSNYGGMYIDYEAANYVEVTPAEALQLRKEGKAGQLRLVMKNGELVTFDSYGKPDKNNWTNLSWRDAYTRSSGKEIVDTRYIPVPHLLKVAKKIYLTDETSHPIDQDKLNRRLDPTYRHIGKEGHMKTRDDYEWGKSHLKYVDKSIAAIKDLKQRYADGDISRNDYERQLKSLQHSVDSDFAYAHKYMGAYRDKKAGDRYTHSKDHIQKRIQDFKRLKQEAEDVKYRVSRMEKQIADTKEKGGDASNYSWERSRIDKIKSEIERLQRELQYYTGRISDTRVQADLDELEKNYEKQSNYLADINKQLDVIMRRSNNSVKESVEVVEKSSHESLFESVTLHETARSTFENIKKEGKLAQFKELFNELYPEGGSEADLNDLLELESDWVNSKLGIRGE